MFCAAPADFDGSNDITPSCNCSSSQPESIPGTELKTRTYYRLGLKRFPSGIVTWTQEGTSQWNYVQIDNDPTHKSKYRLGQEWYKDTLWQFIPVDNCGVTTGWYTLRNGGRPGALWTWFGEYGENNRYIVVDKRYQDRTEDILLRPVKVTNGDQVYYQLQMKSKTEAVVTWTEKKYGDKGSHYLQFDWSYSPKYSVGGEWFHDTLFTAELQKESLEDLRHIETGTYCNKLNITLFKIKVDIDNATEVVEANSQHLECQTDTVTNNGTGKFSMEFSAARKAIESVRVEKVEGVTNVDPATEVEMNVPCPGKIVDSLWAAYQNQNEFKWFWVEEEKEFPLKMTVEIPPCSKYEFHSFLKFARNVPFAYDAYVKVSRTTSNGNLTTDELRARLPPHLEYIRDWDANTILAKGIGRLVASFKVDSKFSGNAEHIRECGRKLIEAAN